MSGRLSAGLCAARACASPSTCVLRSARGGDDGTYRWDGMENVRSAGVIMNFSFSSFSNVCSSQTLAH